MIDDVTPPSKRQKQSDLRSALDSVADSSKQKIPSENESFLTPEEVAAAQNLEPAALPGAPKEPKKQGLRAKLAAHWPPKTKKEWATVAAILLVIIGGSAFGYVQLHQTTPVVKAKVVKAEPKPAPKPTTVPSTLSGLPVAPEINQRPVTGVMIENSQAARPQSGLSKAGVVFEAIAEGGITRFLALFQDTNPSDVGPIRSARPYYVQWAMGFDAGYAHVGGSPEALADIKQWGARDLDQFHNGGSYHRVSSRAAPHNVYTSIDTLMQLENSKGYTSSNFTGFVRKTEAPSKQPTAKSINLNISGPVYNVHYDYNATTNSYDRSEGGAAHNDADGTKISPKVVIALVLPYSLESDGYHSNYQVIGSGTAIVFQDGTSVTGQWKKTDKSSPLEFTDAAGKPLKLNPGQTWLTAVTGTNKVTSAP